MKTTLKSWIEIFKTSKEKKLNIYFFDKDTKLRTSAVICANVQHIFNELLSRSNYGKIYVVTLYKENDGCFPDKLFTKQEIRDGKRISFDEVMKHAINLYDLLKEN